MSPRQRLYLKRGRYYADLRDFADVGGGQEALIPDGARCATKEYGEAELLLARRLAELDDLRRRGAGEARLESYMEHHLAAKSLSRREATIERDRCALAHILEHFGEDVRLGEIDVRGLTAYMSARNADVKAQTLLHELHALSSLYKRALAEGIVGENPVMRLPEKPRVEREEVEPLEPGEVARLLEACRSLDQERRPRAATFLEALVATFVLTGGRSSEVFGLVREEVDFDRQRVRFHANGHRRLKRTWSARMVPLWPQLAAILRPLAERREPEELLFPSPVGGGMLTDIRGSLAAAGARAGLTRGVTPTLFRHTYASMRINTTDGGVPVTLFQVAREMGHRSTDRVEKTYGHLLETRPRREVVEYSTTEILQLDAWRGRREA